MIRPHLEFLKVESQQSLHKPGQRLEYGYFPNQGMVSIVIEIRDGRTRKLALLADEVSQGNRWHLAKRQARTV